MYSCVVELVRSLYLQPWLKFTYVNKFVNRQRTINAHPCSIWHVCSRVACSIEKFPFLWVSGLHFAVVGHDITTTRRDCCILLDFISLPFFRCLIGLMKWSASLLLLLHEVKLVWKYETIQDPWTGELPLTHVILL